VLVVLREGEVVGVAGVDGEWLAGFYVLPEWWGSGVAEELHEAAVGLGVRKLWCLEENRRARRFYERRGWELNGETRVVAFPPNPVDVGYSFSARSAASCSATR
jgi:GNAT superfamily N-acetyltransferase